MSRGVGRFVLNRRVAVAVVGLIVVVALVWWLLFLRPWPFASTPESTQRALDANTSALNDYRTRVEARLRLQLLEAAMADGRRSALLRPTYRLLDDLLDPVLIRAAAEERLALRNELNSLLPDLSRDRSSARATIARLISRLSSTAGPGRQGSGE